MLCIKATHEKEKPVLNKCEAHVFFCACRGLGGEDLERFNKNGEWKLKYLKEKRGFGGRG